MDGEFLLGDSPVGQLSGLNPDEAVQRVRYIPYRGLGHLQMQQSLEDGDRPLCRVPAGDGLRFRVVKCPEYGVLEIELVR